MTFTEESIGSQLELIGYKKDTPGVMRQRHNGVPYGVDFEKQEIFKFVKGKRVYEDPDDELLNNTIAIAKGLPEPTNNYQTGSNDEDERRDSNDATDQSAHEVPSTTKEVAIPNKNIVTAPNPDLTSENIREYLCPTATDQEIFMFLKLCEHRKLNPFIKEAYLIKYGDKPATLVVSKDSFTKKAEDHPQFDGFEAGVVVETDAGIIQKPGTLVHAGEQIIGGWAKVYRKDCKVPFFAEVSMSEYNTGMASWKKIPGTMIRKVALVQALREAFPSDLGGCYDSAEMDQARREN